VGTVNRLLRVGDLAVDDRLPVRRSEDVADECEHGCDATLDDGQHRRSGDRPARVESFFSDFTAGFGAVEQHQAGDRSGHDRRQVVAFVTGTQGIEENRLFWAARPSSAMMASVLISAL